MAKSRIRNWVRNETNLQERYFKEGLLDELNEIHEKVENGVGGIASIQTSNTGNVKFTGDGTTENPLKAEANVDVNIGSISTTQTAEQLNALADGLYFANGAGVYNISISNPTTGVTVANGKTTVESGYSVSFNKKGNVWSLASAVNIPSYDDTNLKTTISSKVEKKAGSNLFDRDFIIPKGMIRSDGAVTTNSIDPYATTGYIKIDSEGLIISPNIVHTNGYNALFDANKNYIVGTATKNAYLPYVEGAVYAMFSISTTTQNVRVNKGQTSLPYEPFNALGGYPMAIADNTVGENKIIDDSVTEAKISATFKDKLLQTKPSTNLFNPEEAVKDFSVGTTGALSANTSYHSSGFIPIEAGKTYTKTTTQTSCWYDKDKVKIGTYFQANTQTAIEGAAYIRCSIPNSLLSTFQINEGDSLLPYEEYNPLAGYLSKFKPNVDSEIKIAIPSVIPAVLGETLQIYKNGVFINIDINRYDYKIVSADGKNYPDLYEVTPTSMGIGTITSSVVVKNSDGKVLTNKSFLIQKKQKLTNPTSAKNILCVGASATANGYWVRELKRRLIETSGDGTPYNPTGLGLTNVTFVGRKTALGNNLEATGGWSWVDYTTEGRRAYRVQVSNITNLVLGATYSQGTAILTLAEINVTGNSGELRFTTDGDITVSGTLTRSTGSGDATIAYTNAELELFNPFWNGGKIDFTNYATLYCNGSITTLIAHAGVNDIFAARTIPSIVENIKTFARALFRDFPNAKFIVSSLPLPCPLGGMGVSYGASDTNDYYTKAVQFYDFFNALEELQKDVEFTSKLFHCPVVPQFDNENSYPIAEVNVNNRSVLKDKRGQNGVHPTEDGAKLVADAIYRTLHLSGL